MITISTMVSLCVAALASPLVSSPSGENLAVDLGYARYRGKLTFPNTVAHLGLPYAEPPLGDLRFRSPIALNTTRVQIEAGGNVVDATSYPDFCVQGSMSCESCPMSRESTPLTVPTQLIMQREQEVKTA